MLNIYHSPAPLFLLFNTFLPAWYKLQRPSQLQQGLVPLCFFLPDVVIVIDATSNYWAFYFQDFRFPSSCSGTWSGSMCKVQGATQQLQAVALMVHKMPFQLPGKELALHLDHSTVNAYICNQGGRGSLFLSRLACHILCPADKHGITLIPAYISPHLNVEADYLSWQNMILECHLLPYIA